jgi:hypothetical protein
MILKQFDRALYELLKIKKNVNEINELFYKTLVGVCLAHCYYYDISIINLSDGVNLIRPLIDAYKIEEEEHNTNKGKVKSITNKTAECKKYIFFIKIKKF